MLDVIIFLLVIALSAWTAQLWGRTNNWVYAAIAITLPTLLGALRAYVGTDFYSYIRLDYYYSDISAWGYIVHNTYLVEPVFYVLTKLTPGNNFFILFGIYSLLTNAFAFAAFAKLKKKQIGLLYLLYLLMLFPVSLNAMRQVLAAMIVSYAFAAFWLNGRDRAFYVTVFAAGLVHFFSLIALIIPLAEKINSALVSRYVSSRDQIRVLLAATIVALVGLIALFLLIKYSGAAQLLGRYGSYFIEMNGSLNLIFFFKTVFLLPFVFWGARLIRGNNILRFLLILSLLEVSFYALGFMSVDMKRIAIYFTPFSMMLISTVVYKLKNVWLALFAIGGSFVYFVSMFVLLGQGEIFPYRTVFDTVVDPTCVECGAIDR